MVSLMMTASKPVSESVVAVAAVDTETKKIVMNVLASSVVMVPEIEVEVPFVDMKAFAAGKGVPCCHNVMKAVAPVGIEEDNPDKTISPATEDRVVGTETVQGIMEAPTDAGAPVASNVRAAVQSTSTAEPSATLAAAKEPTQKMAAQVPQNVMACGTACRSLNAVGPSFRAPA